MDFGIRHGGGVVSCSSGGFGSTVTQAPTSLHKVLPIVVKSAIDNQCSKKKRQDFSLLIRKNKRDDQLRKRRCSQIKVFPSLFPGQSPKMETRSAIEESETFEREHDSKVNERVADLIRRFQGTSELKSRLQVLCALRQITSANSLNLESSELLISPAVFEMLRNTLDMHTAPVIQFEAIWILTNIASSRFTLAVVEADLLVRLSPLLKSPDSRVREQTAWCIGNVAGENEFCRDAVLDTDGILEGLMFNLLHSVNRSMERTLLWVISNMCRGTSPKPDFYVLQPFVPILCRFLADLSDEETVLHSSWALSLLSDFLEPIQLDQIVQTGICNSLVNILSAGKEKILKPCIRLLGNIVSGSDEQTQAVLDAGVLAKLQILLDHNHTQTLIRKEATWVLSNIAAGTVEQIDALISCTDLLSQLVRDAKYAEWPIRKEAAWALCNICNGGTSAQIEFTLTRFDLIGTFCDLLSVLDFGLVLSTLSALDAVLGINPRAFSMKVEDCCGLDRLNQLVLCKNSDVSEKAREILDDYFSNTDNEEEMSDEEDLEYDDGPPPDYFKQFVHRSFCFLSDSELIGVNDLNHCC